MIKYLGEMYNYRVVDSLIIFRTLYLLITYGVNLESTSFSVAIPPQRRLFLTGSEPNDVDPPDHLFRIRLVCTLLDACGQYFDRGTSKKRLDCFLVYFQVIRTVLALIADPLILLCIVAVLSLQERATIMECHYLSVPTRDRAHLRRMRHGPATEVQQSRFVCQGVRASGDHGEGVHRLDQ